MLHCPEMRNPAGVYASQQALSAGQLPNHAVLCITLPHYGKSACQKAGPMRNKTWQRLQH